METKLPEWMTAVFEAKGFTTMPGMWSEGFFSLGEYCVEVYKFEQNGQPWYRLFATINGGTYYGNESIVNNAAKTKRFLTAAVEWMKTELDRED